MLKSKPCKGNYRVNKFKGCGTTAPTKRTYGLCPQCLYSWSNETTEGKEWFEKQLAFKLQKNQKEKEREERKQTRQMKIDLMSTSEYWSNVFQPRFNDVIRLIDKGSGCIATNRTTGKMDAGHYYHAGSNKTLSINAHNIFLQSWESNNFQSGDLIKYQDGLIRVFGEEYFEFINSLKKCPSLHLSKIELIEKYDSVLKLRLGYKKQNLQFLTPMERIELRNEVNETLGLYPKEFLTFIL